MRQFRTAEAIRDSMLPFNQKVIELMRLIPQGQVTTYKLIAHALHCRAYRAVGNAVGANPYAPIVPCHRVVKTDGTVGKFGGGAKKKIALLRAEGIRIDGASTDAKIIDFPNVLFHFLQ